MQLLIVCITSSLESIEKNEDTVQCLQALANDGRVSSDSKQMTVEEWNERHGLRKNGKGLKPGPAKQKPKNVFDFDLVPGEPVDWEAIETEWMEQIIVSKKAELQPLLGKRLRNDNLPDLKTQTQKSHQWA